MSASFPTNSLVGPMLTDMYQISMTYAHWKNKKVDLPAVFDLFFRKNPFKGEYCIFAGSDEVLRLLSSFKFQREDVTYLQTIMTHCEPEFFEWLLTLDCSKVKVYAMEEGSICFPKQPLIRIEGPLAIGQLLETTILNLINFPSLIATNAARMRSAAGPDKIMLEFGLRRAQGPDGAISASKYAYIGGFDGTSNVLAGKITGIDVRGTHAHAYIMCYGFLSELETTTIASSTEPGVQVEFVEAVLRIRNMLGYSHTHEGELAAFISYAQAFPNGLVALVDTYDTLQSGVPNFLCVAYALFELGYKPVGIRLDSGDLAYLSRMTRSLFVDLSVKTGIESFKTLAIVASNDINEEVLLALNREGHEITSFGIGTHLVTCQSQPALGCVYKLVEINGHPRIKLSQEVEKLVIPCKKNVFRLLGADGRPLIDILQMNDEPAPRVGVRILCRHPFLENKRAYVTPSAVIDLLPLVWDGPGKGLVKDIKPLKEARDYRAKQIESMRSDHTRPLNPTPYKISVSQQLYEYIHKLWMSEAPIADLA
jgi:nicotinate phosphoribosyltransferase